jgi:hypothetical protein
MRPSFSEWSEPHEEKEPVKSRIQRKGVGIIEMDYLDDEFITYCPHCLSCGFRVKMLVGQRILMVGEQRPPDFDQFLNCPDCHEVVAAYVVEHDATIIRDTVETVNNPFENQTEIIGMSKRTSKQGIKARNKRNRPTHPDKEIQREIDQHGIDAVNILYDSSW